MANEPCAYYKTALPLWLCEFITGMHLGCIWFCVPPCRRGLAPWRPRARCAGGGRWWGVSVLTAAGVAPYAFAGLVLLFLALFWVLRQSRHPKLRGKSKWWNVETALGSSVFLLLLFTAPGFWYSR